VATHNRRTPIHQIEYYWDMPAAGNYGTSGQPELFVSPDEERAMTERLNHYRHHDIRCRDRYPGSTYGGAKRWLPDRFAESPNG
jgi:heptosyltransferase-2